MKFNELTFRNSTVVQGGGKYASPPLSYLHLVAFFNGTKIKRKFALIWDIFVPLPTTLFEEIPILVVPSISHCVKFQDGAVFLRGFADLPKLQLLQ